MIEFIKKQWFVGVIAVVLLSLVVYFVIDTDSARVRSKKENGQDIVASIDGYNVSADDLYNDMYTSGDAGNKAIVALFKYTVINDAVPTTNDIKKRAEENMNNIIASVQSQYGYSKSVAIEMLEMQMKNSYLNGSLLDNFIIQEKEAVFISNYLDGKIDELVKPFMAENNVRSVSHILIQVADVENPTPEEQAKLDAVKTALAEGKDFGEVAKTYSDDAGSAALNGYLGYSDKNSSWVAPFLAETLKLEEGQTSSDWIKVTSTDSGSYSGFHLVKVNATNPDTLLADPEVKRVIYNNIQSKDANMLNRLIWGKAQELGVTFKDETIEKLIKETYDLSEDASAE